MTRQHAVPLLLPSGSVGAVPLVQLSQRSSLGAMAEADIQALVQTYPSSLPISEIDATFANPVAICTELNTPAGAIDNFMVTPSGLPVLVECKLWRNPEGRREVVGQILDYAKELSRWSSSDLQREVSRRLRRTSGENPLLDLVRAAGHQVDEIEFNDALTRNLRRGRFLLLIVGDGIREGVEAIAEYLQEHAGLHFTLGLVEMPIFVMPDGSRLVTPRVLARTTNIVRNIVVLPDGYAIKDDSESASPLSIQKEINPARTALADAQQTFWAEFLEGVTLDDPEQVKPKPARHGYIAFFMPAPGGTSWLTVYRDMKQNGVGIFLSSERNSVGEQAALVIAEDWEKVREELGGTAQLSTDSYGRLRVGDYSVVGPLDQPEVRDRAFAWLAERVNTFVNVLRPRVRSVVADQAAHRE